MIFEKFFRRIFNNSKQDKQLLTLDDGWTFDNSLFCGTLKQATQLPAVNVCIEILRDSIAKVPIFLMNCNTKERIPEHPAMFLLSCRPTERLTAFDFFKLIESRRIIYGNAYRTDSHAAGAYAVGAGRKQ